MSKILLILIVFALFFSCYSEKIRYIATEHPAVEYYDNNYVLYANLTSRRYGRKDPFYYVGLNIHWQYEFNNNVTIRYIATEHPAVEYYDNNYVLYANLTSRRYGRKDPFYYVGLNIHWQYEFNNNVTVSFYFYEFLTNRYKRGFVEMHWKICDLIHKDKIFGPALKQGMFDRPCPFPAGEYILSNMTIPIKNIPANFPFKKGRIYCNITTTAGSKLMANGHIDMEIKEARTNARNWVDKE